MKLQTKFNLGIIIVFAALAVGVAAMNVNYANTNTIREARNRVHIYTRAAWEILNAKTECVRLASAILAQDQVIRDLLRDPDNPQLSAAAMDYLETIRQEQGMIILNLMAPDGTVILRTRAPFNTGDSLATDPMVKQVLSSRQSSAGYIILPLERLDVEGNGLIERCIAVDGEPRGMLTGAAVPVSEDGNLLGIIQMGELLNGAAENVDKIRDAVFENEYYKGKPVGTATIFMGDLRISTNVLDNQGRRAVGTQVSEDVAEQVLEKGLQWTGRAFVVDTWYLSQYDPIKDPDGNIIGMLYVGELEQKYLDLRARAVALHLTVILAGLVVAVIGLFFMVRGVMIRVRKLSGATRCLSEGDLAHRVVVRGRDELGDLSASFNDMAAQLERQRQEIECRQHELEELSDELRTTNKNYIEMLGFVAHELKNPLTSAMMSLHTVKDGYLGEINDAQRKSLGSVAQSLDYFQDMIKNYLDLSRLERGDFQVNKASISIYPDVIAPTLDALDHELEECRMVVVNHVPVDLVLNADRDLLRVVYDNLLSNAIKYGRPGGKIVLDGHASNGNHMTLSVQNDGEGIPPEKMSLLFGRFRRLDGPDCTTKKGTGLGLYICKEIVDRHGGEIWADSKTSEWVKFSFTLPNQIRR
jgi:two-component system NtrC family sensor kinase